MFVHLQGSVLQDLGIYILAEHSKVLLGYLKAALTLSHFSPRHLDSAILQNNSETASASGDIMTYEMALLFPIC